MNDPNRMQPYPPLFWDIVETSLDEAEFLWARWQQLFDSHRHTLDQIELWAEERLLGALEGAALPGERGVAPLLAPAVASGAAPRIACGIQIAAGMGAPAARELVERALASFVGADLAAVGEGLVHAEQFDAIALRQLLPELASAQQAVLLDSFAAHGQDPGLILVELGRTDDPRVRAAAIACAVAVRSPHAPGLMLRALADPQESVVVAAIGVGLCVGHPAAWEACRAGLRSPRPGPGWAALLPLFAASGAPEVLATLLPCTEQPELRRAAIFALGAAGTRAAAEQSLALLEGGRAELAHVAAESFSCITGLELSLPEFSLREASPAAPSFADDALDAELGLAEDAELPLVQVERVRAWWRQREGGFEPGVRYLGGRRLDAQHLIDFLHTGSARRRHGVALELSLRSGGALEVATRSWTARQRRQLEPTRSCDLRELSRPPLAGWSALP